MLGRGDLDLAAAIVVFPAFVLFCGVVWLVLLRAWEARAGPRLGAGGPVALSAGVALAFGMVVRGHGASPWPPGPNS